MSDNKNNYLAIDIGGTNIKYAIIDRSGNIKEKQTEPNDAQNLSDFLTQIKRIVAEYSTIIKGIGISVPGKVDQLNQTIYGGGRMAFLDGLNFSDALSLDIPIAVENDGKSAALAELWLGNLTNIQNGAVLVLGTAVGGGIIINGSLYAGTTFQAGEVSFVSADADSLDFPNIMGEQASAVNMVKAVNRTLGNPNEKDGMAAFDAINANDARIMPIFDTFAKKVAWLIHNTQATLDLERFVIGGGISVQPIVTERIIAQYNALRQTNDVIVNVLPTVDIKQAKFVNDANLYGAVYHLLLKLNVA